eukprot:Gb_40834 [translate_table: standard]
MSCMTVELPTLRWLNPQVFEGAKSQQKISNMSCVVAAGSPVLGSCRSPSLHDSDIELCTGSPLRSPLHGFQTPKPVRISCRCSLCSSEEKNKFLMCRSPITHHENKGIDGSAILSGSSPVRQTAVVNSLRQASLLKNSPPQENLVAINARNPLQTGFLGSRLRPVLGIRDENHLWKEDTTSQNSPVKQEGSLGFSQRACQRIVPVSIKVTEDESEGFVWKTPSENGEGPEAPKPPSPPLKRKRPPRLDIPQSLSLKTPSLTDELPKEINVEGSHYAVSCKKGRREIMEDTHRATINILGDSKQAFFGVFDGHGGRKAADFVAENIGQNIVDAVVKLGEGNEAHIGQAVRAAYLATDAEFLKQGVSSGTCCVTALIRDGNLIVSNTGDCRAVISRDGNAEALTCDHRAAREDERERIENLGGYVDFRHGVWRVQGVLAVSRGIGDLHMKEWISAEPDTREVQITPNCEFLILASDGLWDKVSNQEAVDLARPFCVEKQAIVTPLELFQPGEVLNENTNLPPKTRGNSVGKQSVTLNSESNSKARAPIGENNLNDNLHRPESQLPLGGPMAACRKLVELSMARGSLDDVSVMIVELGHFCRRKN